MFDFSAIPFLVLTLPCTVCTHGYFPPYFVFFFDVLCYFRLTFTLLHFVTAIFFT